MGNDVDELKAVFNEKKTTAQMYIHVISKCWLRVPPAQETSTDTATTGVCVCVRSHSSQVWQETTQNRAMRPPPPLHVHPSSLHFTRGAASAVHTHPTTTTHWAWVGVGAGYPAALSAPRIGPPKGVDSNEAIGTGTSKSASSDFTAILWVEQNSAAESGGPAAAAMAASSPVSSAAGAAAAGAAVVLDFLGAASSASSAFRFFFFFFFSLESGELTVPSAMSIERVRGRPLVASARSMDRVLGLPGAGGSAASAASAAFFFFSFLSNFFRALAAAWSEIASKMQGRKWIESSIFGFAVDAFSRFRCVCPRDHHRGEPGKWLTTVVVRQLMFT